MPELQQDSFLPNTAFSGISVVDDQKFWDVARGQHFV
jgi:hypothetical protein